MNQKDEEKLVMEFFRKNYPDFPKGKLKASESPDFILKISPKKSIGIELTQLYKSRELINDLLILIEKKEEKIPLYQNMHLSELWLIIYADEALNKINFNLRNKMENLGISSKFDKVFLFDLFSKEVFSPHP